jgi:serine phosphatase RsbU (regulator of sigma subunit)/ketosteroid isomerase-like protein
MALWEASHRRVHELPRKAAHVPSLEQNKALARRFLEAQAKGDMATLDELMAPDFIDRSLLPGQKPGREDYKRSLAEMLSVFINTGFRVEEQLAEGDMVASRFTGTSVHRGRFLGADPTGEETSYSGIHIHRIADGKIAEEWSESDNLEVIQPALEQERRKRELLEQELEVAKRIQEATLPKALPTLEGWRIASYYLPAREVGGDFYDFFELEDGLVGLTVGDATGKGMPAALVVAATSAMLRAVAQALGPSSPGETLARVNEALLARISANMFVTCFYAVLDPNSGRMSYANAGHDLPYLYRRAGNAEKLEARGVPLGLMPGMVYEEREASIWDEHGILFYSDGLVEAHDPSGEMFGFPRLRALLAEHREEGSLGDLLLRELYSFVGEGWDQEDDVTLLTLERYPALGRTSGEAPTAHSGG